MITNIREFLEDCFANAPTTQKTNELKEELFANMCEKYNDLVNGGMSEERAFRRVVDNVGNIDELIRNLSENAPEYVRRLNEQRKKTALYVCIAIAIYVFDLLLLPCMVVLLFVHPVFASLVFVGVAMIPTVMLIYYFMSRPKLLPPNMDVSELAGYAVRKNSMNGKPASNGRTGSILAIFVPISVIIFFVLGFGFGGWAWAWLIFLFTPVIAAASRFIDRR